MNWVPSVTPGVPVDAGPAVGGESIDGRELFSLGAGGLGVVGKDGRVRAEPARAPLTCTRWTVKRAATPKSIKRARRDAPDLERRLWARAVAEHEARQACRQGCMPAR
jgi:hypothetical protein